MVMNIKGVMCIWFGCTFPDQKYLLLLWLQKCYSSLFMAYHTPTRYTNHYLFYTCVWYGWMHNRLTLYFTHYINTVQAFVIGRYSFTINNLFHVFSKFAFRVCSHPCQFNHAVNRKWGTGFSQFNHAPIFSAVNLD